MNPFALTLASIHYPVSSEDAYEAAIYAIGHTLHLMEDAEQPGLLPWAHDQVQHLLTMPYALQVPLPVWSEHRTQASKAVMREALRDTMILGLRTGSLDVQTLLHGLIDIAKAAHPKAKASDISSDISAAHKAFVAEDDQGPMVFH